MIFPNQKSMMIPQVLFIEAGHGKTPQGNKDPGAVGYVPSWFWTQKMVTERQITVDIGRRVFKILKSKTSEFKGTLFQDVGIETTADIIKKMAYVNSVVSKNYLDPKKSFGVAIHVDGNYDVSGFGGYYQTKKPENKAFLASLHQAMHKYFPSTPIRGNNPSEKSRFGRLYIDDAKANYILVETGFMGNLHDLTDLLKHSDRMAESIAHGILEYFRNM